MKRANILLYNIGKKREPMKHGKNSSESRITGKSRCRIPNWTVYTEPARNIWQTGGMRMKMILRN